MTVWRAGTPPTVGHSPTRRGGLCLSRRRLAADSLCRRPARTSGSVVVRPLPMRLLACILAITRFAGPASRRCQCDLVSHVRHPDPAACPARAARTDHVGPWAEHRVAGEGVAEESRAGQRGRSRSRHHRRRRRGRRLPHHVRSSESADASAAFARLAASEKSRRRGIPRRSATCSADSELPRENNSRVRKRPTSGLPHQSAPNFDASRRASCSRARTRTRSRPSRTCRPRHCESWPSRRRSG